MAEKILNTRIQLKYDSLENWHSSTIVLKAGEIAIAYLPPKGDGVAPAAASEAVLYKVGDGTHTFANLPWASALAADVYSWAKEASLTVNKDGTGNVVAGIEWDATANGGKGGLKYTTASVATSEGLDAVQKAIDAINNTIDGYGDIVTHNVAEFATAAQGAKADTAVQSVAFASLDGTPYLSVDGKTTTLQGANGVTATINEVADNIVISGVDATATQKGVVLLGAEGGAEKYGAAAAAQAAAEATAAAALTSARTEISAEIDADIAAEKTRADGAYDAKGAADTAESNAKGYTDQKLLDFENAYIKADENGTIDKLNEIAAWIADDEAGATKIIADVAANAANIQTVSTDLDKVELQLNGIAAGDGTVKAAIEAAQAAAQGYADGLAGNYATAAQGALADTAVQPGDLGALATKDSLTAADVGAATAADITTAINALDSSVAATAEADNQVSVLTGVTQADGKLTDKTEVKLAAIAKTGNVNDLIQTTGDVLVFNCGSATEVI